MKRKKPLELTKAQATKFLSKHWTYEVEEEDYILPTASELFHICHTYLAILKASHIAKINCHGCAIKDLSPELHFDGCLAYSQPALERYKSQALKEVNVVKLLNLYDRLRAKLGLPQCTYTDMSDYIRTIDDVIDVPYIFQFPLMKLLYIPRSVEKPSYFKQKKRKQ